MKLIRISDDVRAPEFVIMRVQWSPVTQSFASIDSENQVGAKKEI
jgi:hypothetical protein